MRALAMQGATVEPWVGSLASFIGGFHPVVVHLPIGIFALAVGLELLATRRRFAPAVDAAQSLVLAAACASAVLAFVLGVALGSGGGYPTPLLDRHRAFASATIVGIAACGVAWWAHRRRGAPRLLPRVAMGLTLVAITATGHLGGSLSRGEGHLLASAPPAVRRLLGDVAPERSPPPGPAAPAPEPRLYDDVVRPVLAARCVGCHGPTRTKGRLRLDDLDALRRGGASGPAIVAGDAARSLLVERVHLPLADAKHMPPEGEAQLTEGETAILAFWIDRGATTELRVRDALAPSSARALLEASVAPGAGTASTPPAPPPSPASAVPVEATPPAPAPAARPPASASTGAPHRPRAAPAPRPRWSTVHEVLERRCGPCHGPREPQGGLRVDSLEALERGGDGGPAVVRGRPGAGTLLARLHAPMDDVDHMPPADEPQLTAAELALLTAFAGGTAPPPAGASASRGTSPAIPSATPSRPAATASAPAGSASTAAAPAASAEPGAGASPVPPAASARSRRDAGAPAPRPPAPTGGGCLSCAIGAGPPAPSPIVPLVACIAAGAIAALRRRPGRGV